MREGVELSSRQLVPSVLMSCGGTVIYDVDHDGSDGVFFYLNVLASTPPPHARVTEQVATRRQGTLKGAYVAKKEEGALELIILAAGSEVQHALSAADALGKGVRVISMPSMYRFDQQSAEYREEVLPSSCTKRVAMEVRDEPLFFLIFLFGWWPFLPHSRVFNSDFFARLLVVNYTCNGE